jgi:hypothetical protein
MRIMQRVVRPSRRMPKPCLAHPRPPFPSVEWRRDTKGGHTVLAADSQRPEHERSDNGRRDTRLAVEVGRFGARRRVE